MIASTQTNHPMTGVQTNSGGIVNAPRQIETATARLKAAGLRITQPRIAILEAMIAFGQPASIEQIHGELSEDSCDLVTVYRCLAVFEELGLVRRSFFHNGTSLYEIEAKGIFARDFDKITVAGNIIGEVELGNNAAESELEIGWAVGTTYEVTPKVKLGVETWGGVEEEQLRWAVGPAISLAPSPKFWLVTTAGFGAADTVATDDFAGQAFSARVIMGIEL